MFIYFIVIDFLSLRDYNTFISKSQVENRFIFHQFRVTDQSENSILLFDRLRQEYFPKKEPPILPYDSKSGFFAGIMILDLYV